MRGRPAPARRRVAAPGLCLGFGLLLSACSSGPAKVPPAPALQAAQRLEQRAVQAFAQGDWGTAQGDYQAAADVYASLALVEPQQLALLSLARVQADAGHPAEALATVQKVLAQGALNTPTERLAQGRAAALLLATDARAAQVHLSRAQALCTPPCAQEAALKVLQARLALQQGQPEAALAAAGASLQAAATPADRANALRLRAQAALALQASGATTRADINAATDAAAALALDQGLGLPARVLEDLRLLVEAHRQAGDAAQAGRYQGLLDQALAARVALQGPDRVPTAAPAAPGTPKAAK